MTPARLMRTLLPSRLLRPGTSSSHATALHPAAVAATGVSTPTPASILCDPQVCLRSNCRCFAQVHDIDKINREVYFSSTPPRSTSTGDHQPPDQRTLQLGKTVRALHERLPTLLLSPLPSDILSPTISLHLFPSTHPHLPTVSGRIGYVAALWTAPVAWGRMPLVGNVRLAIVSERMVRNGGSAVAHASRDEKLIVKWKTCGKNKDKTTSAGLYRGIGIGARDPVDRIKGLLSGSSTGPPAADEQEFCGIFVFEFDEAGRIAKHVIEHTEEGGHYDKMTRVVSVTDWLLGQFNGKKKDDLPALAWCEERPSGGRIRLVDRR